MNSTLFMLGGTGFIGHETIIQAIQAGWQVKALAGSEESARKVHHLGAQAVLGDMDHPEAWITETQGATALIDLHSQSCPNASAARL